MRREFAKPILCAAFAGFALVGCSKIDDSAARFTAVGEEREISGLVTDTKLTLCTPTPEKPGTCEGTLVVEPPGSGQAGRVAVEVTRDVLLRKAGQAVYLPQLRGGQVTVKYRSTKEGPNLATSVESQ